MSVQTTDLLSGQTTDLLSVQTTYLLSVGGPPLGLERIESLEGGFHGLGPDTSRRKNGGLARRGSGVRGLPHTSEPHSGMEEPSLSRGEGVEACVPRDTNSHQFTVQTWWFLLNLNRELVRIRGFSTGSAPKSIIFDTFDSPNCFFRLVRASDFNYYVTVI